MHVEIDQETEAAELQRICTSIESVLGDVRLAVDDFKTMREKLKEKIAELETAKLPMPDEEVAEAREFLRWLDDGNFIFLGFRRYGFETHDGNDYLPAQPDSGLGILREMRPESLERSRDPLSREFSEYARKKDLLIITKANNRSSIHKSVPMDRIGIKRYDTNGNLIGEDRFLGLFTSAAYSRSVREIPMVRLKVRRAIEHGFANYEVMIAKMKKIPGYKVMFLQTFGDDITIENVGKAIASFQRTILSGNSPADRFDLGGEAQAISPAAQRGLLLFRDKARCTKCHSGFNFTDEKFHNLGIGWDDNKVDLGRYLVTKNAEDIGSFKTPTLREISRSAPYMHDGRFKTLDDVVNFYNQGGVKNPHQDPLILPLELTKEEKQDLVQFLKTLTGEGWKHVAAPTRFPE